MEVFKFPFLAEVWGTISDWIMILVTTITAYFLYKTLQSQKDVQEAQNELLKIEQIRLREQFKPEIDYRYFFSETVEKYADRMTPDSEFLSVAVMNLNVNVAINYDFITNNNADIEMLEFFKPQPSLIQGDKFAAIHFIIRNIKRENPVYYGFHFFFVYSDLIGTRYKQFVYCDKRNGEVSVRTHIPEIIKSK
jgi:hypothetical protein